MKKFMALYMAPAAEFEKMMTNATPDQQNALARWGCLVHEMVDHIVDTLNRSGIRDKIMHSHVDATKAPVLRVGL